MVLSVSISRATLNINPQFCIFFVPRVFSLCAKQEERESSRYLSNTSQAWVHITMLLM